MVVGLHLASPWAVDDLHLSRECDGRGSVAGSGTVASHARGEVQHEAVGCAALAGDEIVERTGAYILSPPMCALISRRWQTCHVADFSSRS